MERATQEMASVERQSVLKHCIRTDEIKFENPGLK